MSVLQSCLIANEDMGVRCMASLPDYVQLLPIPAMELTSRGSAAVPNLEVHKLDQPTELIPLIYEPRVCLILQGEKPTIFGDKVLDYDAGSSLVIAAELSALGQVTRASPQQPFLALALTIDATQLSRGDAVRL